MDLYAAVHPRLVASTRAYTRLFDTLAERVGPGAPGAQGLLVPSSTGDLLRRIGAAARWTCVDMNPACLDACRTVLPEVTVIRAALDREWPFAPASFDLAVSVHALHFFPEPAAFVGSVARSLRPGGRAFWVVFRPPETVSSVTRRIAADTGWMEALNFLPWKLADAAMLATSGLSHTFFDRDGLAGLLTAAGLRVDSVDPVFDGCSWLATSHRGD